jgi:hypothetical protein
MGKSTRNAGFKGNIHFTWRERDIYIIISETKLWRLTTGKIIVLNGGSCLIMFDYERVKE